MKQSTGEGVCPLTIPSVADAEIRGLSPLPSRFSTRSPPYLPPPLHLVFSLLACSPLAVNSSLVYRATEPYIRFPLRHYHLSLTSLSIATSLSHLNQPWLLPLLSNSLVNSLVCSISHRCTVLQLLTHSNRSATQQSSQSTQSKASRRDWSRMTTFTSGRLPSLGKF
jgi:hypothetical protein